MPNSSVLSYEQFLKSKVKSFVSCGLEVTNSELNVKLFEFQVVVLDESSILKSYTSKMRDLIIRSFENYKYKLACTATPAPNDHMELGNHAEFVGVMSRTEMLSMFFVHDAAKTQEWRLKKHAENDFWKWMASWSVMMTNPKDLNYDVKGYELPSLNIKQIIVHDEDLVKKLVEFKESRKNKRREFKVSLDEQRQLRQESIKIRVQRAADGILKDLNSQWVVWCDLNEESKLLTSLIPGAVEVKGSDKPEYKERVFKEFSDGKIKVLVTKPQIAGFGMNWQNCHKCVFVGLSYSFEQYYQAVRRFWRFGQTKPVTVYIVTSSSEGHVVEIIQEKEKKFNEMLRGMIASTQEIQKNNLDATKRELEEYQTDKVKGRTFAAYLGDSCELIKTLSDESIDFSIFSPPFASLYTYSNSERDLGNCASDNEFLSHFKYLVDELFRVLKSGRLVSVHCMLLPTSKSRDGYIGIKDFRGDLIRLFQSSGFIFHSEVAIWKNPVVAMQRTKALGLLHKQLKKDSAMSRQGINDYLVTFRKPGGGTKNQ